MIRATSVLIVLVLAATPAATSLCIAWCGTHGVPGAESAGCHRTLTMRNTPTLGAGPHDCDDFLRSALFLREDVQRVGVGNAADHVLVTSGTTSVRDGRHEVSLVTWYRFSPACQAPMALRI